MWKRAAVLLAVLSVCGVLSCGGGSDDGGGGGGGGSDLELCTASAMRQLGGFMDRVMYLGWGMESPSLRQSDLLAEGVSYNAETGLFSFEVDLDGDGSQDALVEGTVAGIGETDLSNGIEVWETGFTLTYQITSGDVTVGEGVLSFVNLGAPNTLSWRVTIVIINPYFVQESPCSTFTITSLSLHTDEFGCFPDYVTSAMLEGTQEVGGETAFLLFVVDPVTLEATVSGTWGGAPVSFVEDLSDDIPPSGCP